MIGILEPRNPLFAGLLAPERFGERLNEKLYEKITGNLVGEYK